MFLQPRWLRNCGLENRSLHWTDTFIHNSPLAAAVAFHAHRSTRAAKNNLAKHEASALRKGMFQFGNAKNKTTYLLTSARSLT